MKQVIYFTAAWCGPCKMIRPVVEELIGEKYEINIVDVDENQQMSMQYGIRSIPTFVVLKDGVEVNRKVGVQSKEAIKEFFK